MTFTDIKDIKAYIRRYVSERIGADQRVNQQWAVTDILSTFDDIKGPDSDFYVITARSWVNDEVKNAIGRYEPKDADAGGQFVLDGFEYLQKAYPIVRGTVRELVPLHMMSDQELIAKADEKYAMAKGNQTHGDEIMHYVESRQQTA